ncbi:lipopolysaccharide assembly protein LapB [Muribaculum sp.]|uniref:tetratricopeptide repeat protein n=1 Tax=Muribaculum sp. TaxID=1918611 RepID=UPI0023C63C59|nr:tetratricopeptide repeat protein [Muribaculum sp.]MDE5704535.1 tetratricopeptide repeat protein [Muribaculum sp.]
MKKLLTIIIPAAVAVFTLSADNFNQTFNTLLTDGNLHAADSILAIWSSESPENPELYPARFNLLLGKARSEMIVLSDDSGHHGEQLTITDSVGNVAGYIFSETVWQDSLVDLAFDEINHGIAAHPDRIDFRLGKAAAGAMTGRWLKTIEAIDGLIDRDEQNHSHWLTSGNTEQSNATNLLSDAVYDRFAEIQASQSRDIAEKALPVVVKATRRFGTDNKIINIAGALNYGLGNDDVAIDYFEKAMQIVPDDALPLTNIAYIRYEQGDTAKALEIYRQIENGNYDEESQRIAKQMIAEIATPLRDMKQYEYLFQYLPGIAAQIDNPDTFLDVEIINSRIPAHNKFRSPFRDTDIKVENIQYGDGCNSVVVWTFPMPEDVPMCRYVAFVSDGTSGCRIYTLEKSQMDVWVIGTMDNQNHSIVGGIPLPKEAAGFVKALYGNKLLK